MRTRHVAASSAATAFSTPRSANGAVPTAALSATCAGHDCASVCLPRKRCRTGPGGAAAIGRGVFKSEPRAMQECGGSCRRSVQRWVLCRGSPRNRVGTVGTALEAVVETVVIRVETVDSLSEGVKLHPSRLSSRFLADLQRFLHRFLARCLQFLHGF